VTEAAISIHGAVKRFGAITAVDHLELEVPPGVCFGLLGPNGAGKSTTMRLLTAQAIADEGDIRVLGHRLPAESKAARLAMGVVPQLDNLDVELTARENLAVFAWLYFGEAPTWRTVRRSGRPVPPVHRPSPAPAPHTDHHPYQQFSRQPATHQHGHAEKINISATVVLGRVR